MRHHARQFASLALVLPLLACSGPEPVRPLQVAVPAPADWTDHGEIIQAGAAGAWDHRTTGALSPSALIEVPGGFGAFTEDTYLLYYIGASGDRADGGPAYRKLGMATSVDGRHWTKHENNPVLAFAPQPDHVNAYEAGVFSAAAWYDADEQKIYLLYGAMTPSGATTVDIAVRLATSTDGYRYTDQGEIIPANGPGWPHAGGRDAETFPVGVWRTREGEWLVWYSSKNVSGERWAHYVVRGPDLRELRADAANLYLPLAANPLGGAYRKTTVVQRRPDRLTTFTVAHDDAYSVTRLFQAEAELAELGEPLSTLSTYTADWPANVHATLHLDVDRGEWLMVHQAGTGEQSPLRLSTAPVERTGIITASSLGIR